MPLRYRLLISALVGLLVFAISCEVGYRSYCNSTAVMPQFETLKDLQNASQAIRAYRKEHGVTPSALRPVASSFTRRAEDGMPTDWWHRPLRYSTDGTHYLITSYGYDGKPGGVGLNFDLSSGDPEPNTGPVASSGRYRLPSRAVPTFRQFAADRGAVATVSPYYHGAGLLMFLASILAGLVAFALSLREVGRPMSDREAPIPRWARLSIIIGATFFVALIMIALDVPSGH